MSACQQASLYNKLVSLGSANYGNSVLQVYAGTLDFPSSLLFCGDSDATRVSCCFSVHSDSNRRRPVSNINYTACVCQQNSF
jgi:hypothetical protein